MTKDQSTSALRRRRQAIKKQRAELKRELREIEVEMFRRSYVHPPATPDDAQAAAKV